MALHTKRLDSFDKLNQLVIKIHEDGPKRATIDELVKTCKVVYYLFDDSVDTQVKRIVMDIQRLRRIEYQHRNFTRSRKEKALSNEREKVLHINILKGLKQLTEEVNGYLDIGEFGMDIDEEDVKDLDENETKSDEKVAEAK